MEPEGSLPHSQFHTTCPYPEPARSSPYPHTPLPEGPYLLKEQWSVNERKWNVDKCSEV